MPAGQRRNSPTLFPILPAVPKGLARMAAEACRVDDGHLIEFRTLKVQSVLNRSVSKRLLWMAYSINPYRGCEFGCRYCYARYTHEFFAPAAGVGVQAGGANFLDPETFERVIFLKQNAAWLLEQDLKRVDPRMEIALGTATDPYQPIERRAKITRSLLEVFARRQGFKLGIVTKSTLIERDIDLLVEIGRRNKLVVHVTVTTPDAKLARKLEPRAPRPDLRLQTVRRLREAGIATGVLCCPVMPGINDSQGAIDGMARRAAEAGASFFAGNPLFLKPCSRPTYLAFVRKHFPECIQEYETRYGAADFVSEAYRRKISVFVRNACERYGLMQRAHDALLTREQDVEIGFRTEEEQRKKPRPERQASQQRLFG